jgi:hypothetical protein
MDVDTVQGFMGSVPLKFVYAPRRNKILVTSTKDSKWELSVSFHTENDVIPSDPNVTIVKLDTDPLLQRYKLENTLESVSIFVDYGAICKNYHAMTKLRNLGAVGVKLCDYKKNVVQ